MEIHIILQGKDETKKLKTLMPPIVDISENPVMTFCLIEAGMTSGEPSVLLISENIGGTVVMQTSLDKLLTACSYMCSAAEEKWGWVRPEGHFSMMPPDKATRKALLEEIRKELEEWDEISGGD